MSESTIAVIESQADWLTISSHGREASANLQLWALARQHEQRLAGNRARPFRSEGYEGEHVGAVDCGRRDDASCLVRLSGDLAAQHLGDALSLSDTVTRVDLAVTCRFAPADPNVGPNTYALADLWHQGHPKSALPWRVFDANGGGTTYVGKRGSTYCLRVYDKAAECRATHDLEGARRYADCWRFELEVKSPMAQQVAWTAWTQDDRPAWVQQYLYDWQDAHGIPPPFPPTGGRALLPGFRRRSDADTKLRHIERNVRPTVQWLVAEGYAEELRAALGLP